MLSPTGPAHHITHGNGKELNEILVTKGDRDRDKSNEMGFDESQLT